jgi:DNA polymerase I-like protein with 3'-5' exonuclease and polymerase domains
LNRDSFNTMSEAQRLLRTMDECFPRACRWRDEVRRQAHEQGYLVSRFGCIRWFWEVCKWNGTTYEPGGDDSEAAVAFLPANDAFCHIKLAMLRLEKRGLLERYGLINQIHDALMFECPHVLVEEMIETVRSEMERPSEILINEVAPGGLSVEVGVKVGKSWERMEEIDRCVLSVEQKA